MAKTYKTFELDTGIINNEITNGRNTPERIGEGVRKVIDNLVQGGFEAATGPQTPRGYPGEILVTGKDEDSIRRGYHSAIRNAGMGDYAGKEGKTYKG